MLVVADLSTVDFAADHGHKPLAGLILGGYALGSAFGGLWCGARVWRAPQRRRFGFTVVATPWPRHRARPRASGRPGLLS